MHEESEPRVAFSGEEVFGKYLDLQALHAQYLALPQAADKASLQWTDQWTVPSFRRLPPACIIESPPVSRPSVRPSVHPTNNPHRLKHLNNQIDYQTYLERFAQFDGAVPPQRKNATYLKYVRALVEYLEGFLRRTQALLDVEGEIVGPAAEAAFDALWKEGQAPGWPLEATGLQSQEGDGNGGAAR